MKFSFYGVYYKLFFSKLDRNKLGSEQKELMDLNIRKHAQIFILMILIIPYVYFTISQFYLDKIDTVIAALFGVLFISGAAWYAISFGAVPVKFMEFAIHITAYLFTAFAISISAVFVAASVAVPYLSPVLFIAFFALYAASVKFDIIDALKLGIDETIYQHAKVGRLYFVKELKKGESTK